MCIIYVTRLTFVYYLRFVRRNSVRLRCSQTNLYILYVRLFVGALLDYTLNKILNPLKVLNRIVNGNIVNISPNIYIAYTIFITIPVANCESEKSSSVLIKIKNVFRFVKRKIIRLIATVHRKRLTKIIRFWQLN